MTGRPSSVALSAALQDALAEWVRLWDAPGLERTLSVSFSRRLRTTLGRATPATGRVVLHDALRHALPARLREVLCHEVAHVVAARRAAAAGCARPRAHGLEWAALVTAAGYRPTALASADEMGRVASTRMQRTERSRPPRTWVVHTCPVCHMERVAQRRVSAWRCAACVANGLSGELLVTRRVPSAQGSDGAAGKP